MTSFKLFAGTDVGLRDNNEDNFTVCPDLTKNEWMVPANQQEPIPLGPRGCIMVVADGMGGMNAGEVASDIAIKTVEQMFSPSKMPAGVVKKPDAIKAYLKKVIISADLNVKKRCKEDPSTEGMGSTIVIAWLIGGNVYIGWMGDSRAYSYIPGKGITRLSKDHSYVQELVDAKMLTEEEAMLHPQSNVIIRSLGDVSEKAKPDIICHPVVKDEIILLCSDGLCGVCTDATIAEIIQQESADLRTCKEVLANAALNAEGSDNITISLLQIIEADKPTKNDEGKIWSLLTLQNILFLVFALAITTALVYAGVKSCDFPKPVNNVIVGDSVVNTSDASKSANNKIDSMKTGSKTKVGNTSFSQKNKEEKSLKQRIKDNSTTTETPNSNEEKLGEPTPTSAPAASTTDKIKQNSNN